MLFATFIAALVMITPAFSVGTWYSPAGAGNTNDTDYENNVVWLNGATDLVRFETDLPRWSLYVHQSGSSTTHFVSSQATEAAGGPNYTVQYPVDLSRFDTSAPYMFYFFLSYQDTDDTTYSHWFNITTDPGKVNRGPQAFDDDDSSSYTSSSTTSGGTQEHQHDFAGTLKLAIGLGVGLGLGALLIAAFFVWWCLRRRRQRPAQISKTHPLQDGPPNYYEYHPVEHATSQGPPVQLEAPPQELQAAY